MKKTNLLLFLISISFFGCTDNETSSIGIMSDLAIDFPTSEKLEFKPFNKYDILEEGEYMIDGSILWQFLRKDPDNIGYCYDLKTGEKISTIASKGDANNEFRGVSLTNSKMTNDSIYLYASEAGGSGIPANGRSFTIKTFAKKDILENKPIGERKFSVLTSPNNIFTTKIVKLPNGSGLATLLGKEIQSKQEQSDINNNSVAIFNDKEVKGYQTIDYDSFDIKLSHSNFEPKYLIKLTYGMGSIEVKDDNLVAISSGFQFILYTLDLNKGEVKNEKRYTKIDAKGESSLGRNEMGINMDFMKSNDKYIYCVVSGYFTKEDKELKQKQKAIFVFDWDLKPIKRFELPDAYMNKFIISQDCSSIYLSEHSEDGLVLTKADLNI